MMGPGWIPMIRSKKPLLVALLTALILLCDGCGQPVVPPPAERNGDTSAPSDAAKPAANESAGEGEAVEDAGLEKTNDEKAPTPEKNHAYEPCIFTDVNGNRTDYGEPSLFLAQGSQSELDARYLSDIREQVRAATGGTGDLAAIFEWKDENFDTEAAGGQFVGKLTVDQIVERGTLSGCHDHGLVLVSVLREFGFPAVMVDAAGIQWALDYAAEEAVGFVGHVFVEVFTRDGWILLDSTSGLYVPDYDPCQPVIPLPKEIEPQGYYALLKGRDPAGYGVNRIDDLQEHMRAFASRAESIDFTFPSYEVRQLPR